MTHMMHNLHPLDIQDILEKVLLFVDKESLVSCSMVNKQWFPLVIEILWHTLHSLRPLLELLAPLQDRTEVDYPNDVSLLLDLFACAQTLF